MPIEYRVEGRATFPPAPTKGPAAAKRPTVTLVWTRDKPLAFLTADRVGIELDRQQLADLKEVITAMLDDLSTERRDASAQG